jgi:hypothetical protein
MSGITITFGDVAENHVGMQKVGKISENGYSILDLCKFENEMIEKGYRTSLIDLSSWCDVETEPATFLVVHGYCDSHKNVYDELIDLEWDKSAKMWGRVVKKHARYNLIFADEGQEPDYEMGKGRIIPYHQVPYLKKLKSKIEGDFESHLYAEGNLYYDLKKCGIGWHGDGERKKVIGCRFGDDYPIFFRWYQDSKPIAERVEIELEAGDIYFMSEKASGNDWKTRKIPTLRHSAGYADSEWVK